MKHINPDKFENFIKESLDNYEVAYDPSHWAELEQKINTGNPSPGGTGNFIGFKSLLIGGAIATGALSYALLSNPSQNPVQEAQTTFENTMPANADTDGPVNETEGPVLLLTKVTEQESKIIEDKEISKEAYPINSQNTIKTSKSEQGAVLRDIVEFASIEKPNPVTLETTSPEKGPNHNIKVETKTSILKNAALAADFSFHLPSNCHSTAEFAPGILDDDFIYEWNFSDGNQRFEASPIVEFTKPGRYTVNLTVESKTNNGQKASIRKYVDVYPPSRAAADFDLAPITQGLSRGAQFTCKSKDAVEWHWDFGDHKTSSEKNPKKLYTPGMYTVSLAIKNKEGCTDITKKIIYIEKGSSDLLSPTAFIPGGDNSNTSTFLPKKLEVLGLPFMLEIFDIKGKMVFKTQEATNPWNGKMFNTGEPLPAGDYIWTVKYTNELGEEKTDFGNIKLIVTR